MHALILLRLLVPDGDRPSHTLERAHMSCTGNILKQPALQLGPMRSLDPLLGGVAARKSHLSAVSASQAEANKMWTKLNFSINGIIPRLMCRLLEQNMRSTQGQTSGCRAADHVGVSLDSQSRLIQISSVVMLN